MTTSEMCIKFRLYAQQAGMQNVRAILPEQIYQYLNSSCTEIANEIIRSAITIPDNSIVVDYGKVGRINALVPLQIVESLDTETKINTALNTGYVFNNSNLYYVFKGDIEYKDGNVYPIDITEAKYVADKLSDYIFKPRHYKPLASFYFSSDHQIYVKLYVGNTNESDIKCVNFYWVVKPIKVDGDTNTNLPEYLHEDIVKRAIELYIRSLGMNLTTSNGAQEQVQQPQYNQQQNQQ